MDLLTDKSPKYSSNVTINDDLNEACSCQIGTQVCPAKSFSPEPPQIKVAVINKIGLNILPQYFADSLR